MRARSPVGLPLRFRLPVRRARVAPRVVRGGDRVRRARALLLWGVVAFALIHTGIHASLERRRPEVYDPEYGARLAVLRERLAESPDRPLLLAVGSSRLMTDYRPEQLPPLRTADGTEVLPFNFSHTGAGPLGNLVQFRRLARDGVRPRWLVVEVLPAMLNISGASSAARTARFDDLPVLRRYMPAWKACGQYVRWRAVPGRGHYLAALGEPLPADGPPLDRLGGSDPLKVTDLPPAEVRRRTDVTRGFYFAALQRFRVTAVADRSTRELLEFARREGIEVVLLLTPESSEFRGWHPEAARQAIESYCATLRREYGVRVIDARTWVADDDFADGHHALPRGAAAFTARLGREILGPLVRGELPTR